MKQFFTFLTTLIIVILFFPAIINAQNNESLWFKISKGKANQGKVVKRKSEPRNAHFYQLNLVQLKARLKNVPLRRTSNKPSSVIIKFPNADGNLEAYRVMEAPVMAPELQAKHPDIRSYVGQSIENPAEIIRFSVTPLGLNTMTLSSKQGTQYIDPYTKDGNNYIVYSKRDLPVIGEDFRCGVTGGIDYSNRGTYSSKLINAGDGYMRTFRLALACTVEYSEFHWMAAGLTAGNTVQERKDAVLAAMNVTMTRVNGIYERELSIKMEIIANNEDIIFIDNDPFTPPANDDPTKLIDESQTQIDATIGSANY
ncbi:MAG TPA: zinc-dependent metalloprotease family protein, partial [Flavobacteriaceae bacterium]|nr:zinc-dependent metalloprotease family protein [Flavobacteriaceae bacterium]